MIKKLFVSIGIWKLLLITCVLASVIFVGTAIAYLQLNSFIDFQTLKIGETKVMILGFTNQTIDPYNINLTTICIGPDVINARIIYYSGGILKNLQLALNGTTLFDSQIDGGTNISLSVQTLKMGQFNCSISPIISNYTNITWV